jgi:hypothetical protein
VPQPVRSNSPIDEIITNQRAGIVIFSSESGLLSTYNKHVVRDQRIGRARLAEGFDRGTEWDAVQQCNLTAPPLSECRATYGNRRHVEVNG